MSNLCFLCMKSRTDIMIGERRTTSQILNVSIGLLYYYKFAPNIKLLGNKNEVILFNEGKR